MRGGQVHHVTDTVINMYTYRCIIYVQFHFNSIYIHTICLYKCYIYMYVYTVYICNMFLTFLKIKIDISKTQTNEPIIYFKTSKNVVKNVFLKTDLHEVQCLGVHVEHSVDLLLVVSRHASSGAPEDQCAWCCLHVLLGITYHRVNVGHLQLP